MSPSRSRRAGIPWQPVVLVAVVYWIAAQGVFYIPQWIRPPKGGASFEVTLKTTAYCPCEKCCGYRWFSFFAYQKKGWLAARPKRVGLTASGTLARPGTIAADPSIYPYGTIMHVPGYGYGVVRDIGGAIKGQRVDLFRPNHWSARAWGVREETVRVWLPPAESSD